MVFRTLLAGLVVIASASPSAAQSIQLSLHDGRVTLITENATPAAILAEWARQGDVRIVDGERVPGTALTLRLENVPEREALDIVLRSAAGFIAAPRRTPLVGTQSRFDRVMVMPSSPGAGLAARNTTAAPPAAVATPVQTADRFPQADAAAAPTVQVDGSDTGVNEEPASSTDFDYANPQRYFAGRRAQQANAEAAAADAAAPQPQPELPAGTTATPFGVTRRTPGVIPVPDTPRTNAPAAINPYGLPPSQSPGSQPPSPTTEPDRGKYMNPYAPTTPRP